MKIIVALLLGLMAFRGHAQVAATRPDSTIQVNVVHQGRYASAFYTVNQDTTLFCPA